jgi:arginine decarboxylase
MLTDQKRAPIIEGMEAFQKKSATSFSLPGHKSGKGAAEDVKRLMGEGVFKSDTSTQKGVDDRLESQRVLQNAQHLAALAWGANHCYFSTNGTSLSNHVAFLCAASPGDTVLVARNSHKSLVAGLILSKLRPVFLEPEADAEWDIHHGIPAAEVERKLVAHPEAKGVFIVSPTFYGVVSDITRIAQICHRHGKPLIVDEAWGPHFPFHPEMPPAAIHSGADMALGSIHKTMSGLQQASILLLRSDLIPRDRFALCFDLFESTSPSGPILATIDSSRRQFALHGTELVSRMLRLARAARETLSTIGGIRVMGREVLRGDARFGLDETKVLFDISALGVTGYMAEDWMTAEQNIALELSDENHLMAVVTVGNDEQDLQKLITAVRAMADWARREGASKTLRAEPMPGRTALTSDMVMLPAEAFFGPTEHVPLRQAAGRIAAEMVSPYPPGIPRLIPGERISQSQVAFLQASMAMGAFALEPSDLSLQTVRVVA